MNKQLFSLLIAILLLANTSVRAEPYMIAQTGIYGLGENNYFKNLKDRKSLLSWRMGAGYLWDFTDNLKGGIEGGLNLYEGYKFNAYAYEENVNRYSIDLLGVLDFHFTNKANVFAKAGIAVVSESWSSKTPSSSVFTSTKAATPKVVLGIGYDLSSDINANIALSHEFSQTDSDGLFLIGSSAVMLGLTYRFS